MSITARLAMLQERRRNWLTREELEMVKDVLEFGDIKARKDGFYEIKPSGVLRLVKKIEELRSYLYDCGCDD